MPTIKVNNNPNDPNITEIFIKEKFQTLVKVPVISVKKDSNGDFIVDLEGTPTANGLNPIMSFGELNIYGLRPQPR